MHLDQQYIDYLKERNSRGIQSIYEKFSSKVKAMILNNNGNSEDAADIFQESLIDIYRLAHQKDFELTCPFEAFLIIVCKRKWLNVLKKRGRRPVTNLDDVAYKLSDHQLESINRQEQKMKEEKTLMLLIEQMGESCRKIIKATMGNTSQMEVAVKLGLSYAYLRKKKSQCMEHLRAMIKGHPVFNLNN